MNIFSPHKLNMIPNAEFISTHISEKKHKVVSLSKTTSVQNRSKINGRRVSIAIGLGIPKVEKREVTKPTPFRLSSIQQGSSFLPHSKTYQGTSTFKARPIPDLRVRPKVNKVVKKKVTIPIPFKRMHIVLNNSPLNLKSRKQHLDEERNLKILCARPLHDLKYQVTSKTVRKKNNELQKDIILLQEKCARWKNEKADKFTVSYQKENFRQYSEEKILQNNNKEWNYNEKMELLVMIHNMKKEIKTILISNKMLQKENDMLRQNINHLQTYNNGLIKSKRKVVKNHSFI